MQSLVASELRGFVTFTNSCTNPISNIWDPEDQKKLLASLRQVVVETWEIQTIWKVLILAGLLGRAASVEKLAHIVVGDTPMAMDNAMKFLKALGEAIFRGGQRPGLSLERVPDAVYELAAEGGCISASVLDHVEVEEG